MEEIISVIIYMPLALVLPLSILLIPIFMYKKYKIYKAFKSELEMMPAMKAKLLYKQKLKENYISILLTVILFIGWLIICFLSYFLGLSV